MPEQSDREIDECPKCGEQVQEAHARGGEIVVSPCGHVVDSMASLEVPPEHRNSEQ
ncbi:MAG: hypothetical protein SVG88_07355 [Halobacteriales archaeon]|nr:hypothetical protein [Halobacteriales archaeon]